MLFRSLPFCRNCTIPKCIIVNNGKYCNVFFLYSFWISTHSFRRVLVFIISVSWANQKHLTRVQKQLKKMANERSHQTSARIRMKKEDRNWCQLIILVQICSFSFVVWLIVAAWHTESEWRTTDNCHAWMSWFLCFVHFVRHVRMQTNDQKNNVNNG